MDPISSKLRIQKVLTDLTRVRTSFQQLQQDYQACATTASDTLGDIASTRGPLAKALSDDTIKNVAADGATIRKEVNEALGRSRSNQNRLHFLIQQANNLQFPLPACQQELQQLALSLAQQPALASLLKQAQERVQLGQTQHLGATRAAGWAQGRAVMGEKELSLCGNDMNAVAADGVGKSVAADAGRVKFRIDQGEVHLKLQAQHAQETLNYEATAILCLQDAEICLQQALQQPSPGSTKGLSEGLPGGKSLAPTDMLAQQRQTQRQLIALTLEMLGNQTA